MVQVGYVEIGFIQGGTAGYCRYLRAHNSEAIIQRQGATNEARNVLEYEEDAVSIATGQRMSV